MNRDAFRKAIAEYSRYDSNCCGAGIICSMTGPNVYHIRAYDVKGNRIYRSDEPSIEAAMDISEGLEHMISISNALFSWIGT